MSLLGRTPAGRVATSPQRTRGDNPPSGSQGPVARVAPRIFSTDSSGDILSSDGAPVYVIGRGYAAKEAPPSATSFPDMHQVIRHRGDTARASANALAKVRRVEPSLSPWSGFSSQTVRAVQFGAHSKGRSDAIS
jgi:hypothetical protein